MSRSKIVEQIMENWNISVKELNLGRKKSSLLIRQKKKRLDFVEVEEKDK